MNKEVENMCYVNNQAKHGPAPIPEEGRSMLLRHKDSYAAPLAKTVFSLPFVVICNSAK